MRAKKVSAKPQADVKLQAVKDITQIVFQVAVAANVATN